MSVADELLTIERGAVEDWLFVVAEGRVQARVGPRVLAEGLVLPILTAPVVVAWIVVAVMLYREYRVSLLANLRGRALDPRELTVDDHSQPAHHRSSGRESQRTGRAARARHPDNRAAPGTSGHDLELSAIAAAATDSAADVKIAVGLAVISMGSDPARKLLDVEITRLALSPSAAERSIAAAMIGAFAPGHGTHRNHLTDLIADSDSTVVRAALDAVRLPDDADLLGAVLDKLHDCHTASAAAGASRAPDWRSAGDCAFVPTRRPLPGRTSNTRPTYCVPSPRSQENQARRCRTLHCATRWNSSVPES